MIVQYTGQRKHLRVEEYNRYNHLTFLLHFLWMVFLWILLLHLGLGFFIRSRVLPLLLWLCFVVGCIGFGNWFFILLGFFLLLGGTIKDSLQDWANSLFNFIKFVLFIVELGFQLPSYNSFRKRTAKSEGIGEINWS